MKKNQFMRGMAAFWILDAPSAAAETSPGDSRRLPRAKIAHHPAVGERRMQRKQVKVESSFFSTLAWKRPASLRLLLGAGHEKGREMKKGQAYQEVSLLSPQSCQYGDKWLFNILHRVLKWWGWGGGDVRVTTAAVYWRETGGVEEARTRRKMDPETRGRENI